MFTQFSMVPTAQVLSKSSRNLLKILGNLTGKMKMILLTFPHSQGGLSQRDSLVIMEPSMIKFLGLEVITITTPWERT